MTMKYAHKNLLLYILLSGVLAILMFPAQANAQTVIRDAEIESYMKEWFTPIFNVNNLQPSQVKIIIVQSNDINAFVAGGSNIFFYTGLIDKTENPDELIGVMAHELGHISGGHLVRGREAMEQASYESIIGTLIGIGAAVATGKTGAAGAGSLAGSSMAQRRFLSTARTFESSADQAALASLNRANMNPTGLLTFLQKLEGQEMLPSSQQSEYVLTHPLTRTRVDTVAAAVEKSSNLNKKLPAEWMDEHARMKAKLLGFINPQNVSWVYDDKDQSIPAQYARAIADYRQDRIDQALKGIDKLISIEPNNPYFYELKGQMLLEFGRVAESLAPYQKSVDLKPDSGLIRVALAHAQIETAGEDSKKLQKAIDNLHIALRDEPRSTQAHRLLATAYGRQGNDPMARLHLAEEALLQQKYGYAKQQADIALKGLDPKSAAALRANDILTYIKQKKKDT
ncbi:MAG TPA: M48 family metalloprotease [Alphaproteobacteria bacterium]|nr:M48 family metalloprotease [Alphaproteobacteria bacterium]